MKWQELDAKAKRKAIILAAIVGVALVALMWPTGVFRSKPKTRPSPVAGAARRDGGAPPAHPPIEVPKPSPDACPKAFFADQKRMFARILQFFAFCRAKGPKPMCSAYRRLKPTVRVRR